MDTTTAPAETEPARCVGCTQPLDAWDLPRFACDGCQQRTVQRLGALPALYAALDATPTRPNSSMVGVRNPAAGSRVLVNLDVIDFTSPASRDSVFMRLMSWADDWTDVRRRENPQSPDDRPARWDREDDGTPRDPVAALCHWLRWHLDWACRHHPAIDDMVDEIDEIYMGVHGRATGERPPRPMRLACHCGGVVKFRLGGRRFRCDSCAVEYGYAEATRLPPARRTVAA